MHPRGEGVINSLVVEHNCLDRQVVVGLRIQQIHSTGPLSAWRERDDERDVDIRMINTWKSYGYPCLKMCPTLEHGVNRRLPPHVQILGAKREG